MRQLSRRTQRSSPTAGLADIPLSADGHRREDLGDDDPRAPAVELRPCRLALRIGRGSFASRASCRNGFRTGPGYRSATSSSGPSPSSSTGRRKSRSRACAPDGRAMTVERTTATCSERRAISSRARRRRSRRFRRASGIGFGLSAQLGGDPRLVSELSTYIGNNPTVRIGHATAAARRAPPGSSRA